MSGIYRLITHKEFAELFNTASLHRIGINLSPEQEQALLGKLLLVVNKRMSDQLTRHIPSTYQRELWALSEYADHEAVERWLDDNIRDYPRRRRNECAILFALVAQHAQEIQASGGEQGIPFWSDEEKKPGRPPHPPRVQRG